MTDTPASPSLPPPAFRLIRETPWVKEWSTPWGPCLDSKLRWFGAEPSADRFLADWADPASRRDLEAAFHFFPYELAAEIDRILATIAQTDPDAARRMRQNLFTADAELTPDQQRFLSALTEHLLAVGADQHVVGENAWFRVSINDGGFHFETKLDSLLLMPTPQQLASLHAAPGELAYARALRIVRQNPWLIEPLPGEQPFLGLDDPLDER